MKSCCSSDSCFFSLSVKLHKGPIFWAAGIAVSRWGKAWNQVLSHGQKSRQGANTPEDDESQSVFGWCYPACWAHIKQLVLRSDQRSEWILLHFRLFAPLVGFMLITWLEPELFMSRSIIVFSYCKSIGRAPPEAPAVTLSPGCVEHSRLLWTLLRHIILVIKHWYPVSASRMWTYKRRQILQVMVRWRISILSSPNCDLCNLSMRKDQISLENPPRKLFSQVEFHNCFTLMEGERIFCLWEKSHINILLCCECAINKKSRIYSI